MSELTVIRLTREAFDAFVTRFQFSGDEIDFQRYQVYFLETSFSFGILGPTGQMIGAFGIVVSWRGVGECWFMSSPMMNRFPKWQIKTFRELSDLPIRQGKLHRVQMHVDNDNENHHRWARLMGFKFEGVLRKHSVDAEDHAAYAKTS